MTTAVLNSFEITKGDTTCIGKDIGYHFNILLKENFIRFKYKKTIGYFDNGFGFNVTDVVFGNDPSRVAGIKISTSSSSNLALVMDVWLMISQIDPLQ